MEKRKEEDVEWGLVWDDDESRAEKRIILDKLSDGYCFAVEEDSVDQYINKIHYTRAHWKHWKPLPGPRYMTQIEIMKFISENSNCWVGLGECEDKMYNSISIWTCLLYTSPSPRDGLLSRMPSSA